MSSLLAYKYLLLKGALVTLASWLSAGVLSLLLGTLIGILSCRRLVCLRLKWFFRIYVFIAKGVPAYVQILIAYFVIPACLKIQIPGIYAALGALVFCSSGYVAEIVRAGLNSINIGQWEACLVLGYPTKATLSRIILPQVFKNILPALLGEFEQLLKSTALLATIGIAELTRTGMNIISRELNPVSVYLCVALIYLIFSAFLQLISWYIDQKLQRSGEYTGD